uniref:Uncharacterized protein n=1 Tax=Arundo donax TaxID=35708 RepID=A0A0A9C0R6_ARUDO
MRVLTMTVAAAGNETDGEGGPGHPGEAVLVDGGGPGRRQSSRGGGPGRRRRRSSRERDRGVGAHRGDDDRGGGAHRREEDWGGATRRAEEAAELVEWKAAALLNPFEGAADLVDRRAATAVLVEGEGSGHRHSSRG